MNQDHVEIIERTRAYAGYLKLDRYRLRHRRHDGGWTETMSREVVERGHAVCVLPYDPVRDEVVLIEQFRVGAFAAGQPAWQIEIVAGIIEPGESLEEVARRETQEEAGCTIDELVHVATVLTSPGVLTETAAVYCARADAAQAGGVHGIAAEHEDIRAFAAPLAEALAWCDTGRLQNTPALIALGWLARHRDELRQRWTSPGGPSPLAGEVVERREPGEG